MVKILHFADAHIDSNNQGRQDPVTGLPVRVMDFLKSLDKIVDTAIEEEVDLVIFAGDAYKNRNPTATIKREWNRRIMRLSDNYIPTILLVGNHDMSPSLSRAHVFAEFKAFKVPYVLVVDKPVFLTPTDLFGIDVQVMAIPWLSRSGAMAHLNIVDAADLPSIMENKITNLVNHWLGSADPSLPIILTAHAMVQGANLGNDRTVTLGREMVLSGSLVKDKRFDYVALGHIHKRQNLNEGYTPPVMYPGSIERVDFGEVNDYKAFWVVDLDAGVSERKAIKLDIREFVDVEFDVFDSETLYRDIDRKTPSPDELRDCVVRLTINHPSDLGSAIDTSVFSEHMDAALSFQLRLRPTQNVSRSRLPDIGVGELSTQDLFWAYFRSIAVDETEIEGLHTLALAEIIN